MAFMASSIATEVWVYPAAFNNTTVPVFEVHLSDPHKREAFRHLSYVSMGAKAVFAGHGAKSYELALDAALQV